MTCKCDLQLDKCFWPGQCEMDIVRHKTNQQATADHTAKMFNESKIGAILRIRLPNSYSLMRKKEIKMTRKEAIEKFNNVYRGPYSDQFVAGLEALGLIKFDEEITMSESIAQARYFTNTTQEFINRLNIDGYKIVKK